MPNFFAPLSIQFFSIVFNALKKEDWHWKIVVEDPHIPFLPYIPSDKDDHSFQALVRWGHQGGHVSPVVINCWPNQTKALHEWRVFETGCSVCPDPPGVSTLENDVHCRFRLAPTMLASRLMRPPPDGQAVRGSTAYSRQQARQRRYTSAGPRYSRRCSWRGRKRRQ